MGSRERKIILIIALIVAAAVIAAVCIYMSPEYSDSRLYGPTGD